MNTQRLIVTAGSLGLLLLPGCADPCADDGLMQDQPEVCPLPPGLDGTDTTDGPSTTTDNPTVGCANGIQDGDETDVDCGGSCITQCGDGEGCMDASDCQSGACGADMVCTPSSSSCSNGQKDGEETDIDCGGPECDPCNDGQGCEQGSDCSSNSCDDAGICQTPTCDDGAQNGDETGVDCGGSCDPCPPGGGCMASSDCQTGVCDETTGMCAPARCDDGVQNGSETDLDCGGQCGSTCEIDEQCLVFVDCIHLVCDPVELTCSAPTCDDGTPNGNETDVDCGGPDCDPCNVPGNCEMNSDCLSDQCDGGTCVPASCADGVLNGTETDIDCGGLFCVPCDDGETCVEDSDCSSQTCDGGTGTCVTATCDDGIQNGNETDIDCGGPDCLACPDGQGCDMDSDCLSMTCNPTQDTCEGPSCGNGVQDGSETDIDCGGPECGPCPDGEMCMEPADCASELCDAGTCVAPACDDGVRNGFETDLDCGGPECEPCPDDDGCLTDFDCASMICLNEQCQPVSCVDGIQNGDETGIDCGGPDCAGCDDGGGCQMDADCTSGVCDPATMTCTARTCTDNVLNGSETDIDCGGPDCPGCDDGGGCQMDADCSSGICDPTTMTCTARTCTDNVLNGSETGLDCGGPDCPPCDNGDPCQVGTDCTSGVCDPTTNTCVGPACTDGVQNGDETGVDCGGPLCDACGDGGGCTVNSDCESMVCNSEAGVCEPPNCGDGVQNGDETDLDCGGICGMTCDPGEMCLVGADCVSAGCDPLTLTCNELLTVSAEPACADYNGLVPVPLLATASGGTGGPYTYVWSPDDGSLSTPNLPATTASPTGFQTYTVTVNDGFAQAEDSTVVVNANPFNLQNNCTLLTANYGASSTGNLASIAYSNGGTRACEFGNNEFGLHLCTDVVFEQTRLQGTLEVTDDDNDNDWLGLVWGAQDDSNFYSLVWKAGAQDFFGCTTPTGMMVKRVEGPDFMSLGGADFYCPSDTANSTLLLDPSQSYDQPWVEGESYTVTIDFIPGQSDITVTRDSDGTELASFGITDSTFSNGFFGSTTLSQANACVGPLLGSCL